MWNLIGLKNYFQCKLSASAYLRSNSSTANCLSAAWASAWENAEHTPMLLCLLVRLFRFFKPVLVTKTQRHRYASVYGFDFLLFASLCSKPNPRSHTSNKLLMLLDSHCVPFDLQLHHSYHRHSMSSFDNDNTDLSNHSASKDIELHGFTFVIEADITL